ncbi:rab proteins geranylgeranyltransferase component A [Achlya hypogyna]|uniref:Rab proteins geranylgeranyltransferase component A n=1 Tax=Achlya hypogyna TaxID=1202772 RepID=A0A1V9Z3Z9_ACHHY|nr:rab proteins geranylgeranyltransferase component A [Achlya hypogyna]
MEDALYDTKYDVVLVGTGIVESIVAGALARAGKKVLHLDTNDYYGSNYASLTFDQFQDWMAAPLREPSPSSADVVPLTSSFHCSKLHEARADDFTPRSTSFSIDVHPKVLLSSSPLVDVLVHSGVGRYLDFMAMHQTCMYTPQPPHPPVWQVPCSKTDVFKSRLSVLEKRHLMKFLQFVADYGDDDATTLNERDLAVGRALKRPQNKRNQKATAADLATYAGLVEALTEHFKLSPTLRDVVLHAVLLLTETPVADLPAGPSLDRIFGFLSSIGRFAPSPFLTPLYGIAEVGQAFCRLSAVYGGVYYLRAPLTGYYVAGDRVVSLATTDAAKCWTADHFVVNAMYAAPWGAAPKSTCLLRGVFLFRGARDRTVIVVPPHRLRGHPFALHALALDGTTAVCPAEHTLVHLSTPVSTAMPVAEMIALLQEAVAALFPTDVAVWESTFTVPVYGPVPSTRPANLHVCDTHADVALETTLESAVQEAKAIFYAICPDADFLPKSASAEQAETEAAAEADEAALLLQAATTLLHADTPPTPPVAATTPKAAAAPEPAATYTSGPAAAAMASEGTAASVTAYDL